MPDAISVLVWSEERAPRQIYPNGINVAIAEHLNRHPRIVARSVSIDDDAQGVPEDTLAGTDVLVWWGIHHDEVADETADRVARAIERNGLGFIALHSAHYAPPFTAVLDASGDLGEVRLEAGEMERIDVVDPDHPIVDGVGSFALPRVEMFGEPHDIPEPDDVVLESTFSGGGYFRSGVTFTVGEGRVFYFRPGHEEFRIYYDTNVARILENAVVWARSA